MPERLNPGASVHETDVRTRRIEPADTSVTALLGTCPGGPADEPVAVDSPEAFERAYRDHRDSSLHRAVRGFFSNGGDRALTVRVTRQPAALAAVATYDWQLLVVDPGVVDLAAAHALCLRHRAFLVCDAEGDGTLPPGLGTNAAAYFPPFTTGPSAAAVAGVLARVDAAHGVWRAPSGDDATLAGTLGRELTRREVDELGVHRLNALRTLPNGRVVVWGSRTASEDPEWTYVPVRRLVLFLERSIQHGLQWAAFEPNDESLWAGVRRAVDDFLFDLWKKGAMAGTRPEQGYVVRCDRSTMTQADIDDGRVVVLVGVAPLEPAESS